MCRVFAKFPLNDALWNSMTDYYSKYFFLFSLKSDKMLVPTLFIDFVWHTHLNDHNRYFHDCETIAKTPLVDHDDSVGRPVLVSGLSNTKGNSQEMLKVFILTVLS
jgi:hypothetical protein